MFNDQQFFNLSGAIVNIVYLFFESGLFMGVINGGNNIYLDLFFIDVINDDYIFDGCLFVINVGDNMDVVVIDFVGVICI